VNRITKNIGRACPELLIIVLDTIKRSGYAITTAKEEFFVKFKYWFVRGGIIDLKA
tara:strand:- start:22 stop:189 length:168 start_codon:yes stop_codon:yes gene_type:complete